MSRRLSVAVLVLLAVTACGSTVQVQGGQGQAQGAAGDGLTAPTPTGPTDAASAPADQAGGQVGSTGGTTGGAQSPTSPSSTEPTSLPTSGTTGSTSTSATTSPIQIGFVNTKVGNADSAGLNAGYTYTTNAIFQALVKAMNAHGGMVGRKIVPVTAESDTAASDWSSQFQAACATFTQDHKVTAVIGYVFGFFDNFESCLAKRGVIHLNGAYTVGDKQDLARFPTLYATSTLTADRRYLLQVAGAVREGYLKPGNKVGLLVDECPNDQRAINGTVLPYLKAQHITVAITRTFTCAGGAGDIGGAVAQVQGAVLAFRSAGVDRVVSEGIPLVLFATSAETQGYRPGYTVTSTSGGSALEPNMPKAQLANVHGYGWMPEIDVDLGYSPPKTASQQRCLQLLASQQVKPVGYNDFLAAYTTCDGLFLYEKALGVTHGASTTALVTKALNSLGTTYQGVGVYSGRTSIGAGQRNLPLVYRPWGWNTGCQCFRYTGGDLPLP